MVAIEHPKVFISYAWESEEYKDQVRSFASDLMRDQVEVVLDQWSLREGNDMYAFMEKSVTDPSITNVLILLSPRYAEKANAHAGGVGTEAQIISPEVYGKTDQTKFLPVVMQRRGDGAVCKPAYLGGTLYFDLSDPQTYGREYKRLVRSLYGIETHRMPELGSRPTWLEEDETLVTVDQKRLDSLRGNDPPQIKRRNYERVLEDTFKGLLDWRHEELGASEGRGYIDLYLSALPLRDAVLSAIKYYPYIDDGCRMVSDHYERFRLDLNASRSFGVVRDLKRALLHELMIYWVAIALEYHDYEALGQSLGRDYLLDTYTGKKGGLGVFHYHDDRLDKAVRERDGQPYLSAVGKFWLENVNVEACREETFILADELCYNAMIMSCRTPIGDRWFPLTYIYDSDSLSIARGFAGKLRSESQLRKMAEGFGFTDVSSFVERYRAVEADMKAGHFSGIGYLQAYHNAPLLCQFVSAEELGVER